MGSAKAITGAASMLSFSPSPVFIPLHSLPRCWFQAHSLINTLHLKFPQNLLLRESNQIESKWRHSAKGKQGWKNSHQDEGSTWITCYKVLPTGKKGREGSELIQRFHAAKVKRDIPSGWWVAVSQTKNKPVAQRKKILSILNPNIFSYGASL